MKRTTVYLPDDLKADLEQAAAAERRSEAELIREGVQRVVAESTGPAPQLPLFTSGQSDLAERADEYLRGFGER